MPLFERVAYHISHTLPQHLREDIARLLDANGATKVEVNNATHVVSDTIEIEGRDAVRKDAAYVSPYWVERSMELGQLQDPKYFSANKDLIFSGLVATSSGIPLGDKEVIIAGIKELGGQWREGLTRDVTHLFVTNTQSDKYHTAMHFRDSAHIIILLPQWFDQCWSMQMRIPHDVFEFPDPAYLNKDHDNAAYQAQMFVKDHTTVTTDKRTMFRAMQQVDGASSPAPTQARDIWQGRTILLSSSLALDAHRRESVETRISRAGGKIVVAAEEDETAAVDKADVLVTRFRAGSVYARALAEGKMIGTLAWLFYVDSKGVVSQPRDQLLHYPVRNKPIEGFSGHEITVTNYQGEARDYLKKLIEIMGAKFTPTMSGRNTIVIAAFKGGNKTDKADEWSVPVVTHKWLEDCFVEWRNLTPAQKRYIDYAPGVNYGTVLGERGVGHVGLEEDPELPPSDEGPAAKAAAQQRGRESGRAERKDGDSEGLTGTATSAREAREVEHALDLGNAPDHGDDIDDAQNAPASPTKFGPPRGATKTPMKIGPPRGVSKTPAKTGQTSAMKPASKKLGAGEDELDREKDAAPSRKEKPVSKQAPPILLGSGSGGSDVEAPRGKSKPKPRERDDMEHSAPAKVPVTAKPKPRPVTSKTPVPVIRSDEERSEDGEEPRSRLVTKGKASSPRKAQPTDADGGDGEVVPKPKSIILVKKKPHPKLIPDTLDSDEESSHDDETPPRIKSKPSPKTYKSKGMKKGKAKAATPTSESESDKVREAPPKNGKKPLGVQNKGKAKALGHPLPNRIVTVDLPDPRSLLGSVKPRPRTPDAKPSGSSSKHAISPARASPGRPPARTTSIRAAAYEAPSATTPKRGRPLARDDTDASRSSTPLSPAPRSPRRPPGASLVKPKTTKAESMTSRRSSPSPPRPPPQRTPSSRTAAAAATKRLHEDVMPDANNYENERKRGTWDKSAAGRRRKSSQYEATPDNEEESEGKARGRKRQKIDRDEGPTRPGKTKVAKRHATEESDMLSNVEAEIFITHIKNDKRPAPADDGNSKARKKVRMRASSVSDDGSGSEAGPSRSSCDPKKIRVLATKIDIPDHTKQALGKLGVKFAKKNTECTHLVAASFARTEKFLCALPNVPFVLREDWLTACVKSGIVVVESDYCLTDAKMEQQHDFKLTEALERARELKRQKKKLLEGHFFYITKGVPIPYDLLKNVLKTNGAEAPTSRNLSETRHVVSCEKDQKIWRPLAREGFPIYSQELVLMAALAQYVDWDGESKRVPGSLAV